MLSWKTEGTKLYQSLPKEMFEGWRECEPLREIPEHLRLQPKDYKPFGK
jgi:hypothetical protein